jgi:spermidine synthase
MRTLIRKRLFRTAIGSLLVATVLATSVAAAEERVLFEVESPYNNIRVVERQNGLRYMTFGVFEQTAIRPGDPSYLHYAYARSALAALAFLDRPARNLLLVGLGGGTIVSFLARHLPELEQQSVEIDPLVVQLARKYFALPDKGEIRTAIGDGRQFLRSNKGSYDVIMLDAYKVGGIPFHLTTVEFMRLVKERTAAGGVVAAHLWGAPSNPYFDAQIATFQTVFPHTYIFQAGEGSVLLFGSLREGWLAKEELVAAGRAIGAGAAFPYDLGQLIGAQYGRAASVDSAARILTDDHAPVDLLLHGKAK